MREGKQAENEKLYEAILTLKDLDECKRFFSDLCTVYELRAMGQRFEVAMLLSQGMIYNDILERTGASSATISRVNRSLQYGADGYQAVLPRLKEAQGEPPAQASGEAQAAPEDHGPETPPEETEHGNGL